MAALIDYSELDIAGLSSEVHTIRSCGRLLTLVSDDQCVLWTLEPDELLWEVSADALCAGLSHGHQRLPGVPFREKKVTFQVADVGETLVAIGCSDGSLVLLMNYNGKMAFPPLPFSNMPIHGCEGTATGPQRVFTCVRVLGGTGAMQR